MTGEVKAKITSLAAFILPLVALKLAAILMGEPGPSSAPAAVVTTPPDLGLPGPPPQRWSEQQREAAKHIIFLQSQPFGPTPLYHREPDPKPLRPEVGPGPDGPEDEPPPNVVVQAILTSSGGNIAVIGGAYYRVGDALDDAGWVVAEIDGVTRSVTLAHPRTGRTATIGIPMPR